MTVPSGSLTFLKSGIFTLRREDIKLGNRLVYFNLLLLCSRDTSLVNLIGLKWQSVSNVAIVSVRLVSVICKTGISSPEPMSPALGVDIC